MRKKKKSSSSSKKEITKKKKKHGSTSSNSDSSSSSSDSSDSDDSDKTELADKPVSTLARKRTTGRKSKASDDAGAGLRQELDDVRGTVTVDEDTKSFSCILEFDLSTPFLLMQNLCDVAASKANIRYTRGIGGVFIVGEEHEGTLAVQCDGASFNAAFANEDLVDVNKIKANDVWQVRLTLGVEASRRTLVDEISGVFGAYGIGVDARHLSLISDFMCQQGGYRPFSRVGINDSTSPFLKMTYETATAFLTEAAVRGDVDSLQNPSAAIVLGKLVNVGTGSIGLQYDATRAMKLEEEMRSMGIEPAKKFTPAKSTAPAANNEKGSVTFSAFKSTPSTAAAATAKNSTATKKHVTFTDDDE